MIVDNTNGYLEEVKASTPAQEIKGHMSLTEMLAYLDTYANHRDTRCVLFKDFAPLSFAFTMEVRKSPEEEYRQWFNGGLIFHGDHDGGGDGGDPTLSVNLNPMEGWSVHT